MIFSNKIVQSNKKSKSGFTLIELLVVVAIIAVLVSMLLPALQLARENARSTVCQSGLKEMGTAFMFYASEYNDTFPLTALSIHNENTLPWWTSQISKYIGVTIPRGPNNAPVSYNAPVNMDLAGVLYCPSDPEPGTYYSNPISYGANRRLLDHRDPGRLYKYRYLKLGRISYPSNAFVVAENEMTNGHHFWYIGAFPSWPTYDKSLDNEETDRHMGGMNLLYADGRADRMNTARFAAIGCGLMGGPMPAYQLFYGEDSLPNNW